MQTVTATLDVGDSTPVEALSVGVDIKHTFIGDLVITLQPPGATGVAPVVLHRRAGGSTKDLKKQYDAMTTPGLAKFAGKSCKGTWTLKIQDAARQDSGTLVSFSLGLSFAHPDRAPRVAEAAPEKATKTESRRPARAPRPVGRAAPRPAGRKRRSS
jgi:subtilisin-like proprotein convertase family protein